jgi:hypothetical protein
MSDDGIDSLCQLSVLGLSCFGCCGHDFGPRSELKRDIRVNKKRYEENKKDIEQLKNKSDELRVSGICKLLVHIQPDTVGCPLHPKLNNGEDLRETHCDIEYQCTTSREFISWNIDTREEFIDYIRTRDLDFIDYSIKMAGGSLLGGFKRSRIRIVEE